MQNKFWVSLGTIVISVLSIFYLSFTFVGRNVEDKARAYAMDDNGVVNYAKKKEYLDSLRDNNVIVYNLGVVSYTYKQVSEREINLGLDLRGGMNVVLEVSPTDILRELATETPPQGFEQAMTQAIDAQKNSQERFSVLFLDALQANNVDLKETFATVKNKEFIKFSSADEDIREAIIEKVDESIGTAEQIIKTRIDQFGVTQPLVQKIEGTGRIQVELPGVDDDTRVRELLKKVAKLEFMHVYDPQQAYLAIMSIDQMLYEKEKVENGDLVSNDTVEDDTTTKNEDDGSLFADDTTGNSDADTTAKPLDDKRSGFGKLIKSYLPLRFNASDIDKVNDYLSREDVKRKLPRDMHLAWGVKPEENGQYELYALRLDGGKPALAGDVVADARMTYDQYGKTAVSMSMESQAAQTWKKLTGDNIGKRFAIVLDNRVYSAPVIQSEIPGGNSIIQGSFSVADATDLANVLKAGRLPAPTRIVEEAIVGPTLGLAAQESGLISIISGLVIVILFMIGYYAKGGAVANLALLFNIFFIFGILASPGLGASLTLPGLAGIVLTIGMSIDANVLIFERIREEMKVDANMARAITQGYEKAFWTIFDANVTTFLTAIFLFAFGSGPIKGFATVLMIGIVCSFFSAVYITRMVISYMTKDGKKDNISFATPFTKGLLSNVNIDFLGKRKIAYIFSAAMIIIGLSLIGRQGLNLGVDFEGGRSYQVKFGKEVSDTETKSALSKVFTDAGLEVKTFGDDKTLKITTNYLIDEGEDDTDQKVLDKLITGLEQHTGAKYLEADKANLAEGEFAIPFSSKVGATIADDIASASRTAVLFSLAAIFFYIWVRFRKWRFGLGAVIALFHDTLMVFSVFAIARALGISYEIDQVFVAAMLTIIGYSINDTVVVFDRVREYLNLRPSQDTALTFNQSINGTLNRTIVTSVTTLIVALILFLFGGEALGGFSFAMLIGVFFGTYSSIFIATPLVYDTRNIGGKKAEEVPADKVSA